MVVQTPQLSLTQGSLEPSAIRLGSFAARDWEIVTWVARIGAVTIEQIRTRFQLGRTVGYRRVAACAEAGLLERVDLLRGQPALIRATRRGLRFSGTGLGVAQAPPELVGHWITCADVALLLEAEFGWGAIRSEREIRALERGLGRPLASASLGDSGEGERFHRADLAVVRDDSVVAVEVELTPKAPRRLEQIVRAWRRARAIESIRYYVPQGATSRAVERAIASVHAGERVQLHSLTPATGLRGGR